MFPSAGRTWNAQPSAARVLLTAWLWQASAPCACCAGDQQHWWAVLLCRLSWLDFCSKQTICDFAINFAEGIQDFSFGVADLLPYIPALSSSVTQAMIFLEDGQYDLDDLSPSPTSGPDERAEKEEGASEEAQIRQAMTASRHHYLTTLEDAHDQAEANPLTQVGGAVGSASPTVTPTEIRDT